MQTFANRQQFLDRFRWWLVHRQQVEADLDALTAENVRGFLAYLWDPGPDGRWSGDHHAANREPRPSTVETYFKAIRAFTNFCRAEGLISGNPLKNVKTPEVPEDDIVPFSVDQVQRLIDGARQGGSSVRDVAIILVLVDTGLRVSELCGLTIAHVQRGSAEIRVRGKGNKHRTTFMGTRARRALWRYLELDRRDAAAGEPVFISAGGHTSGEGLTKYGVYQIVRDAGARAGIEGVRCSPHTCRHTFAINFLRNGGDLFELQRLMGHADLTTLQRYVKYAKGDLAEAHRSASPADHMKLR